MYSCTDTLLYVHTYNPLHSPQGAGAVFPAVQLQGVQCPQHCWCGHSSDCLLPVWPCGLPGGGGGSEWGYGLHRDTAANSGQRCLPPVPGMATLPSLRIPYTVTAFMEGPEPKTIQCRVYIRRYMYMLVQGFSTIQCDVYLHVHTFTESNVMKLFRLQDKFCACIHSLSIQVTPGTYSTAHVQQYMLL